MQRSAAWVLLSLLVAAPLCAQNVSGIKPMVATPKLTPVIDYQKQWEQEREKNRQLREENAGLRDQLAQWTQKGGSLVHAYCATETLSRNSAGASNDCAATGYSCEPVSGMYRTMVRSSECAPGFLMDVDHCVRRP